jgi:Protein of unknown function (DUF1404)
MSGAASAGALHRAVGGPARGLWELATAGLLALLAGPSPLAQRLADQSLAVHMLVEHWMLLGAGALAAVAAQRVATVSDRLQALGRWRAAGAVLFLAILATWHVPALFGAAVASQPIHATMHLSYMAAGAALMVALPAMDAFGRVLLLLGLQALMTVLALAMYTGAVVYPWSPVSETATAGVAMFAGMQAVVPVLALGPRLAQLWRDANLAPLCALLLLVVLVLSAWLP